VPPRIHRDLYSDDPAGEVRRLIALGATAVHWSKRPPDADYVILADPEGNRFCVVSTTQKRRAARGGRGRERGATAVASERQGQARRCRDV
jgi:ABC-type uncharacterized transport system permease subunit